MKKPVISILLFYMAGILFGRYLPLHLIHLTIFIIVTLSIGLILHVIGAKKPPAFYFLLPAFILAGAVAINYRSMTLPDNHISNLIPDKKTVIEGVLYKSPEVFENRTRLYIDADKVSDRDAAGKVRITLYRDTTGAGYKDRVRIRDVRLKTPRNFKNPGGFDYKKYMEDQGIYVTGGISKGSQIEIIEKNEGGIFSSIYKSKDKIALFLERNAPPEESAILKTMVFGERSAISREMRNIFTSTGIAHLLAVSGLNVGFVAFTSFLIFKKFFSFLFLSFYRRLFLIGAVQRFAAFFTLFPVLYYSILVGDSPSAVRAGIMTMVYLLSLILYREGDIYNTLSLSAIIILIWHPPSLFNIGFQLSFIAVLSIAYGFSIFSLQPSALGPQPKRFLSRHRWLYNYIISSIFATAGTLPLIVYNFNIVSIIGLIVNIAAIPISSLITPLTLLFSILSFISEQAASFLITIPVFLTFILVEIARLFTNIPYYSIRVQTPSLLTIFMIYPLLFGVLNIKRHRWIKIWTVPVFLFFISFLVLTQHSALNTQHLLKVTFIDVGQGESSLIQFPNGKTMLIDGGGLLGDFDIGGMVVAPYLWDTGITKIDYVIGTHPDSDHVGGLPFILKEMGIKIYFDSGQESSDLTFTNLHEIAGEKAIPYRILKSGDTIDADNRVKVEILHPSNQFRVKSLEFREKPRNLKLNTQYSKGHDNNLSIVMKITYNKFSIIFTGDIEKDAEKFLLGQGFSPALKSTIIKVPHHGSSSSSIEEFIKAVNPEAAVFSVGYNNQFHHPNKKVLKRYKDAGAKIYRTDMDGMIQIESDGRGYSVKTYEDMVFLIIKS